VAGAGLLKALQAETAHPAGEARPPAAADVAETPIEPETRRNPAEIAPPPAAAGPGQRPHAADGAMRATRQT
jgi:hypothetical protein